MEKIIINGGKKLSGSVKISGSKNAVLPIIIASVLADGESVIYDVPDLTDVHILKDILTELGAKVIFKNNVFKIDPGEIKTWEASYESINKMRASVLVMGPLLAKFGRARVAMPGGCAIGTRPIDLHLKGFESLGAKISLEQGFVSAVSENGLKAGKIYLDFPSVGATENIMMAAALADGVTTIENAAEEPEIVDLANFLNSMGGNVKGAGTNVIKITGVSKLSGAEHTVIPDRIEAGTYLLAGAVTGSCITIDNVISHHIKPVIAKLRDCGVEIEENDSSLTITKIDKIKATDIKTMPYPGFPTDMQSVFTVLMCMSEGTSIVTETVFENRFMHIDELKRMGANVKIEGKSAVIDGVKNLSGCQVKATDLRAGAALILAGLVSEGTTEVFDVYHIFRGYENIIEKFQGLGADITYFNNNRSDQIV